MKLKITPKRYFKKRTSNIFLPLLLFLVGLTIILVIGNFKMREKNVKASKQLKDIEADFKRIKRENEILQSKISEINSPAYLEMIARDDLNLQRQGEKVVVFPNISRYFNQTPTSSSKSFWQGIMDWLSPHNF